MLASLLLLHGARAAEQATEPTTTPSPATPPAATPSAPLPPHWDPKSPNPVVDAVQVWRLGGAYFTAGQRMTEEEQKAWDEALKEAQKNAIHHEDGTVEFKATMPRGRSLPDKTKVEFKGIDGPGTGRFLDCPSLKPVVQFSCSIHATPYEDALEKTLEKGTPELKLQALAILVRVQAPHSAAEQWKVLQELKRLEKGPLWKNLLGELEAKFDPKGIAEEIKKAPPKPLFKAENETLDDYSKRCHQAEVYYWHIRAAGGMQLKDAVPRLKELSSAEDIDTSLAAEKSLEDFEGPECDQFLVACVLGFKYNAWMHAADALMKRNPGLLAGTLKTVNIPERARYMQGVYLGRLGDPAAVPILCATVPKYQMIDKEIFELIGKLATLDQAELVKKLPETVRPEQRDRAAAAVQACLERWK
ncbi:MAG: hypothetical protein HY291_14065 [Planctomycetes bacterium]|nr:hypothetical protein [Planctomycetota bacterium]